MTIAGVVVASSDREFAGREFAIENPRSGMIGPDYHVCVDEHSYSVLYILVGDYVEGRRSATTIEIKPDIASTI